MDRNIQVIFGLGILRLGNFRHCNQFLWKVFSAPFIGLNESHPQFLFPLLCTTIFNNGVRNGVFWIISIPHWPMGKNAGYCNGIWTSPLAICTRKTNESFHLLLTSSVFTCENVPQNKFPIIWHTPSYTNDFLMKLYFKNIWTFWYNAVNHWPWYFKGCEDIITNTNNCSLTLYQIFLY